jgi:hypothetical protein
MIRWNGSTITLSVSTSWDDFDMRARIFVIGCLVLGGGNLIPFEARAQNVTASVSGEVRLSGGATVGSGSNIKAGDIVRTGANASVSLLLKDRTAFTVGADAVVQVTGTSSGTGGTGFEVSKGGFRLITGEQDPTTYKIKTPQATLGVRGTIIEGYVDVDLGIEVFVLVEGAFQITTSQGTVLVNQPGTYVIVSANGSISPPAPWQGQLLSVGASLNLSQAYLNIVQQFGADALPNFNGSNAGFKANTYNLRFPPTGSGQGGSNQSGGVNGGGDGTVTCGSDC